jgi:hypothetical protein
MTKSSQAVLFTKLSIAFATVIATSEIHAQLSPMPPAMLCVDAVCPPPSTPVNLDFSAIPWHNGSGPWGPQVRIQTPALPATTRTVNVSTREQFNQAAAVAGTLINVTASWAANTNAIINASNVDVVIPRGISIGAIEIGAYPRPASLSRIRIRGTTPGTHSGGRMGQYRDYAGVSDVTIDGIDMNGQSGYPSAETNQAFRASGTRIAVLNTRAIAAAYIWLGSARHVVISRSNFFHGAATISTLGGDIGGWGFRNTAGPFTILDSRIQGTRYNNVRMQASGGQGELFYAARTTFVNTSEGGRTAWLWDNLGNSSGIAQGAIIEDSTIYSYGASGCGYADLRAPHAAYTRVRRNRFFSGGAVSWSQSALNGQTKYSGGDHDWSVGHTFASISSLPPWGGPGDPTQIPIPMTLNLRGTSNCLSPY